MTDVLLGLLLILLGAFLCLNGQATLRLLLAVWGALVGFATGAGLVTAITGDGFLSTAFGWLLGFVLALVFSVFAYLYFSIAVIVSMASAGFALGGAIASAIGLSASWILVIAGTAVGLLLALLAIVADLPQIILVIASAVAGSAALVTGVTLLVGVRDHVDLTSTDFVAADHPWWYAAFVVIALVGVVVQSRRARAIRTAANLQAAWASHQR